MATMMARHAAFVLLLVALTYTANAYVPPTRSGSGITSFGRQKAIQWARNPITVCSQPSDQYRRYPRRSRLFSSPTNDSDNDKPKRRRSNPLAGMKKSLLRISSGYTRLATQFRRLSRRAKIIVSTQLALIGLLMGLSFRKVYIQHFSKSTPTTTPIEIPYSTFLDLAQDKKNVQIANVLIGPDRIGYKLYRIDTEEQRKALEGKVTGVDVPQRMAYTRKVSASPDLLNHLRSNDISFAAAPTKTDLAALSLRSCIVAFYVMFLLRMYKTMSGGGGGSPGKLARPSSMEKSTSFDDIEGIDHAKFEVMELVDTLRNPEKYAILGARAPTGLLLEGPPGTGKTMLARATAATAGVPLLYCSGSDFVEMFVGRGAARVRGTFEKAAKLAPCIIFIDELDALGKSRDSGVGLLSSRGNDEAEQTLNQLLACMDGLDSTKRVCVMAATNRKDVLDPALVRPGRFDRIIQLQLPSQLGRERILRVHAKKLPGFLEGTGIDERRPGSLGKGRVVDLSAVAAVTSGLSGAELEFIVNEAAIRAVRRVSAELREGVDPSKIVPTVEAIDFEESVRMFFDTRRSTKSVGDLFRSLKK